MGSEQAEVQFRYKCLSTLLQEIGLEIFQGSSHEVCAILPGRTEVATFILYTIPRDFLRNSPIVGNTDYSLGAIAFTKPELFDLFNSIINERDVIDVSRLLFSYAEVILPLGIELDRVFVEVLHVNGNTLDLNVMREIAFPKTEISDGIPSVTELLRSMKVLPEIGKQCEVKVNFPNLIHHQPMILYHISIDLIEKLREFLPSEYSNGAIALFEPNEWKQFVKRIKKFKFRQLVPGKKKDDRSLNSLFIHASVVLPLGNQPCYRPGISIFPTDVGNEVNPIGAVIGVLFNRFPSPSLP